MKFFLIRLLKLEVQLDMSRSICVGSDLYTFSGPWNVTGMEPGTVICP